MPDQLGFFQDVDPGFPGGFRYRAEVIPPALEESLLLEFGSLPFERFQFHQYTGNRRVVSYGWKYDYSAQTNRPVDPIPSFLLPVRDLAAGFAGLDPHRLEHALVTEYSPGTAIGWHRDKAVYDEIIGVSLLAACTFRLRRKTGTKWERVNLTAERRSMYLLSGPARTEWEHSIPPVETLRYSITFRNLLDPAPAIADQP